MRDELLRRLPPYQGKEIVIADEQTTKDIMSEILDAHNEFADHYDKISSFFWKGNAVNTARFIFQFLKQSVKYSVEPDSRQSVKSPAAIVATGIYKNGYNDCKHYSLFAAGVLDSLRRAGKKINWFYRFANYKYTTSDPGHVFVVVVENGVEFWCDPVLPTFNNKKQFVSCIDKKPKMLVKISGIGQINNTAFLYDDGSPVFYKGKPVTMQGIGKKGGKKGGFLKKVKTKVLKVAGAPSRNAFLGMVGINLFGLALKLYRAMQKDEPKLKAKWEKLGGNYKKLRNTILHGIKKQMKKRGVTVPEKKNQVNGFGMIGEIVDENGQIGVIQFAGAAALAAALPILTALKEFVGSFKKDKSGNVIPDEATAAAAAAAAQVVSNPQLQAASGGSMAVETVGEQQVSIKEKSAAATSNANGMPTWAPWAIGGAAALILLTRNSSN